jgi:hypothetical protein
MSFVRIKNITTGKLVFLSVRDFSGEPLTLEAGEEKDVFPSMASQPSIRRVIGTKVIMVDAPVTPVALVVPVVVKQEVAVPLPPIVEEPVTVVAEPIPTPVVEEVAPPVVEEVAATPAEAPKDSPFFKSRKGRR